MQMEMSCVRGQQSGIIMGHVAIYATLALGVDVFLLGGDIVFLRNFEFLRDVARENGVDALLTAGAKWHELHVTAMYIAASNRTRDMWYHFVSWLFRQQDGAPYANKTR